MGNIVETLVINLYGGPGVGKSTCCAGVFAELKWNGINCEMAREYAKDIVWEGSLRKLENQIHVFGEQQHRLHRLVGKVDVVLTDSPLLLSLIYGMRMPAAFKGLVLDTYNSFNNYDIYLEREKPYQQAGRIQDETRAREIDDIVYHMLNANGIEFVTHTANRLGVNNIAYKIMTMLDQES